LCHKRENQRRWGVRRNRDVLAAIDHIRQRQAMGGAAA
jgi:hypothetical protein